MNNTIKTKQELIEAAKNVHPIEKRIEFIMSYFKNFLKYNYTELLLENSIRSNIQLTDKIAVPGSFLDKIGELCEKYKEDYDMFFKELKELARAELHKYIQDEHEIEIHSTKFVEYCEQQIFKNKNSEKKVPSLNDFVFSLGHSNNSGIIDQNGLLIEGVCRDFSAYLVDVMKQAGIKDVFTMEQDQIHQWMCVKVDDNYYVMDMNSITSIRDQKVGLTEEYATANWYHMDIPTMFKVSPKRKIDRIGQKRLEIPITSENYTPVLFEEQWEKATRESDENNLSISQPNVISFGKLVAKGLDSSTPIAITDVNDVANYMSKKEGLNLNIIKGNEN